MRKSGHRVRVSVQLIDGPADCHIWAERYDRELEDIFALQDEVTAAIVGMLPGKVEAATGDEIQLDTLDALKPATVRSTENPNFLYLLMPVRVS